MEVVRFIAAILICIIIRYDIVFGEDQTSNRPDLTMYIDYSENIVTCVAGTNSSGDAPVLLGDENVNQETAGVSFGYSNYGPSGTSKSELIQLQHGLHPKYVITVLGFTNDQISYNIIDNNGHILFHFNPNVKKNKIVMNSFFGKWGPEERPDLMLIKSGVTFHTTIAFEMEGYRVYVNGEEIAFYKHRTSCSPSQFKINYEDAKVYNITYGKDHPKWALKTSLRQLHVQEFADGVALPYKINVQLNKTYLSWLLVTGITNSNARRMNFNFFDWDNNLVFHFNPRFFENNTVCNTLIRNAWGEEERTGGFPFVRNQRFTIAFVLENNCFRVYVNGQEFTTFNHRKSFNSTAYFNIQQDLKILKIICQK